ncbi:MAG: hypothetical protein CSB33_00280 [Desulfobacterales bacterium]|nr:MAG: hypothetical protein CSB33_00280 [Desulfobacterales bacterium]
MLAAARHYADFNDFVLKQVRRERIAADLFLQPQIHYITDGNGELAINFLGRFERLARDFEIIAGKLGIRAELPVLNSTRHAHYAQCYTSVTRQIAADVYAADIDAFGYRFQ